jgi:hypothetical protein
MDVQSVLFLFSGLSSPFSSSPFTDFLKLRIPLPSLANLGEFTRPEDNKDDY